MQKVSRRGVIPHATVIPIVLTVLHSGTKYTINKRLTGADRSMRNIYKDLARERDFERETARERESEGNWERSHGDLTLSLSLSLSLGPKIHALEKCFFVLCCGRNENLSARFSIHTLSFSLTTRRVAHAGETRRNVENNDVEKRKIASTVRCVSRRRMRFC